MPIREYQCVLCNKRIETLVRNDGDVPKTCDCGGELQQCFSFPGTYFINGDNGASQRPRKSRSTE